MTCIQSSKLTGHKGPVTCLANNSHDRYRKHVSLPFTYALLSGSEDGTVRLWDLKMNSKRAALCITCPFDVVTEVTSVAFHTHVQDNHSSDTSSSIGYPFTM